MQDDIRNNEGKQKSVSASNCLLVFITLTDNEQTNSYFLLELLSNMTRTLEVKYEKMKQSSLHLFLFYLIKHQKYIFFLK